MKNSTNIIYLPLLLFSISTLFLTSCKKDEAPAKNKFLGAYSVIETCGNGNDSYELSIIESGSGDNAVVVMNLYDLGQSLSATVSGNNLTIPSQLASGVSYNGNGSISGNTLTINFTISAGTNSDSCNSICNRK